ncbi:MAG: hypothetical protein F6J97_08175 [Leptolyngbya sp. SIO4C1]|nr:hypothetical protein [Leptolyngbya sp. SIO4C1]
MPLSIKQIKAAQLMAKGHKDKDVWPAVGISEGGFYKWKKQLDFQECLEIFTRAELERSRQLAAMADASELSQAQRDERAVRGLLASLVSQVGVLLRELVEATEADDLSARQIPQLMTSLCTVIESLRTSNDRLSGLEDILHEISKLEARLSDKVVSIASASKKSS